MSEHSSRYNSSSVSVIGEGSVYRGDIEFEGILHINGDFYGNIKGNGDLGVGLTGRVRSVIHADNLVISGLVHGEIFALGRVAIKSSAIVVGNIQATALVVEKGSILHGRLEISQQGENRGKVTKSGLSSYSKDEQVVAEPSEENGGNPGKYSVWN